ncbi:hypothetical protein F0562_024055 [Nyssa sinensis]|uniref:Uncharacterized protein n=1 Tax=Nyssa sinensis TaxID=561372 RepID=A0A5J5BL08_9ASTE|nr:hypothetical protein F0562_024055 [Nyssa sinensis]
MPYDEGPSIGKGPNDVNKSAQAQTAPDVRSGVLKDLSAKGVVRDGNSANKLQVGLEAATWGDDERFGDQHVVGSKLFNFYSGKGLKLQILESDFPYIWVAVLNRGGLDVIGENSVMRNRQDETRLLGRQNPKRQDGLQMVFKENQQQGECRSMVES